jgi:hypothetical protein
MGGLIGHSRDILHQSKGITFVESTKIRWFSRRSGWGGWSLLSKAKGSKPLKEDHQAWVYSDQMVLIIARREAGPVSGRPLKGYIFSSRSQGGLSCASPLRSDGSRDSQMVGGTGCPAAKGAHMRVENNSKQPRDQAENRQSDSLK